MDNDFNLEEILEERPYVLTFEVTKQNPKVFKINQTLKNKDFLERILPYFLDNHFKIYSFLISFHNNFEFSIMGAKKALEIDAVYRANYSNYYLNKIKKMAKDTLRNPSKNDFFARFKDSELKYIKKKPLDRSTIVDMDTRMSGKITEEYTAQIIHEIDPDIVLFARAVYHETATINFNTPSLLSKQIANVNGSDHDVLAFCKNAAQYGTLRRRLRLNKNRINYIGKKYLNKEIDRLSPRTL